MEKFCSAVVVKRHPSFFSGVDREDKGQKIDSPFSNFKPVFKWNYMLLVFSYFNGSDLFHVFSRLSTKVREELPKSGFLD